MGRIKTPYVKPGVEEEFDESERFLHAAKPDYWL